MGRLRLSVIGFAEPQGGKCNDSRLFCIHTESAQFIAFFAGADSIGLNGGGCYGLE